MVKTEPGPVLRSGPTTVGVVVLDRVDAGGLLVRLHLHLGPGEGAGHGGAEEDVDTEHDQEQDAEHNTQPEKPGRPQLTVTGVG